MTEPAEKVVPRVIINGFLVCHTAQTRKAAKRLVSLFIVTFIIIKNIFMLRLRIKVCQLSPGTDDLTWNQLPNNITKHEYYSPLRLGIPFFDEMLPRV